MSGLHLVARFRRWRVLASFLVVLTATLSSSARAAAQCPVKIFFGNGVDTPQDEALETVWVLRAHVNVELNRRGLPRLDEECFDSAYATDVGRLQGIINTGAQLVQDNLTTLWRVLTGLEPEGSELRQALQAQLTDSINVQLDDPHTGSDLRLQLGKYLSAIVDSQQKVIVVAHSQGNAFANSAFSVLATGFDGHPPTDLSRFSIIAVATPANHVATGGQYTTLYGDIILASGGLPANTDGAGTVCGLLPPHAILCHDFVNSYLVGLHSEPRIVSQVVDELLAAPAPPPVTPARIVGDSLYLDNCGVDFPFATRYTEVRNGRLVFEASPYGFACASPPFIASLSSYYSAESETSFVSVWTFFDGIGSSVPRARVIVYGDHGVFSLTPGS